MNFYRVSYRYHIGKKMLTLLALSFQLNFKKGDAITLTQKEDGGWWEGTLDGKTGWFPSNYVKETGAGPAPRSSTGSGSGKQTLPDDAAARQADYRQQVVRDLLEKEREFVAELRALHKKYISAMHRAEM